METMSIGYALLCTQNALLGVVTPQLRAVVIDISTKREDLFYIRVYYDEQASEKRIDLWECMITEASAHLGAGCFTDGEVERIDYPKPIPLSRGTLAYLRKEPYPQAQTSSSTSTHIKREIYDHLEKDDVFSSPVDNVTMPTHWGVLHEENHHFILIPSKPENYPIPIVPVAYALLGLQRALLGIVTPELRSVIADASLEDHLLYIRFYYDKDPPNEVLNQWEYAMTKTWADMGTDYVLDGKIEKVPYPEEEPFRGRYAYRRREKRDEW